MNCNINADEAFPLNDQNGLKHYTRCESWRTFRRSGNRMLLHCKDLQRSPDAFSHTKLGYPVTTTQNRAEHESWTRHSLFTSSIFCSGVTLKMETKVTQREEEGEFFKGQVLRKAFLPVGDKNSRGGVCCD